MTLLFGRNGIPGPVLGTLRRERALFRRSSSKLDMTDARLPAGPAARVRRPITVRILPGRLSCEPTKLY